MIEFRVPANPYATLDATEVRPFLAQMRAAAELRRVQRMGLLDPCLIILDFWFWPVPESTTT